MKSLKMIRRMLIMIHTKQMKIQMDMQTIQMLIQIEQVRIN